MGQGDAGEGGMARSQSANAPPGVPPGGGGTRSGTGGAGHGNHVGSNIVMWGQARSVFRSAILSPPQGDAAREGEKLLPGPGQAGFKSHSVTERDFSEAPTAAPATPGSSRLRGGSLPAALSGSSSPVHPRGAHQKAGTGKSTPGSSSTHASQRHSWSSGASETQQFMVARRSDWVAYLQDEITMLRIDRQNLLLEKQQAAGRRTPLAPPKRNLTMAAGRAPHGSASLGVQGNLTVSLPPPSGDFGPMTMGPGTVASDLLNVNLPEFRTPRTPNTVNQERQLSQWKAESALASSGEGASGDGTTSVGKTSSAGAADGDGDGDPASLEAVRGGRAGKGGEGQRGELSARKRHARNISISSTSDLERLALTYSSTDSTDSPRAQLLAGTAWASQGRSRDGAGSEGVQAAKRAAEAATAGKNRMLRMWERMQRMMPQTPDDHPSAAPEKSSKLIEALKEGEILSDSRGGAWVSIACATAEDPLLHNVDYVNLLLQAPRLPESVERDVLHVLTLLYPSGSPPSAPSGLKKVSPDYTRFSGRSFPASASSDSDKEEPSPPRQRGASLSFGAAHSSAVAVGDERARALSASAAWRGQAERREQGEKAGKEPSALALCNLVKAYLQFDPELGYSQGLGFLAGTVLGVVHPEEDAFAVLAYLLQRCGVRGLLLPDMSQLQLRMYQLSQLLGDHLPRLQGYFDDLDLQTVMFAGDWFLTLFSRRMPSYMVLRVIDIVLAEKTLAIVFKLSLVLLQVSRRQLLQCPQTEFCLHFLRSEFPDHLKGLSDAELEEFIAKALRENLPFEDLLRLEAEYAILAGEAAAAAREVQTAALASEAAAASWESDRRELQDRLLQALEGLDGMDRELQGLFKEYEDLLVLTNEAQSDLRPAMAKSDSARGTLDSSMSPRFDSGFDRGFSASGRGFSRSSTVASRSQVKNPAVLLRQVSDLRKQRTMMAEQLSDAEKQLVESVKEDNRCIQLWQQDPTRSEYFTKVSE